MAEQIRFWLTPVPEAEADPFLGPQMAYDLAVLQPEATVGDYLTGLAEFQAATLADCKGCDGCCHERAPLTIADWQLSGHSGEPAGGLAEWLLDWAELSFCGPAVDLTLRRSENGSCQFLDEKQKCCTIHPWRSFTCRSQCWPTQNGSGRKPARGSHQRPARNRTGAPAVEPAPAALGRAWQSAAWRITPQMPFPICRLADWAQAKLQDWQGRNFGPKFFQPA